ncbi:solute carrier family 49 member 4 homolog [Portunus trituberculatus]|uniref:solute carrier family 49 member 4 homolog n=1 Tax=Portunus trituberculatus TaxID=210409 RepID=UPI001E1CE2C5|nr:solute carrier family 49 member 4 homolog [Portunus trituberculatus]
MAVKGLTDAKYSESTATTCSLVMRYGHGPSFSTTTITTTTTTTTPVPQDTDEVDGVLFNTGPLSNGRATPDLANSTPTYPHLTHTPSDARPIRVYLSRFWILATFSFLAMFQCLMWNTWGPISTSIDAAYPGWGSGTVAMMGNWGTIMFVLTVAPMCWVMNAKGLRVGVLLCGGLVAAGTLLRALPLIVSTNATFFTVMCHICAILVGIAGTLVMAAPPMIAAVWFPPRERTTATAFCQMMNMLGNGGSYLEPLMVQEPSSAHPDEEEVEEIRNDIKRLVYIWAGVGVMLMAVLVAYFPAKPRTPPSITSHVDRLDFRSSLSLLNRNKDLLLLMVSYGVSVGVPSAWLSVLNFSLYDLGLSQDDAMWVGISGVLVSCGATLVTGRFTDLIYGHIKLSLILISASTIVFFYWFFLLSWHAIPVSTWQIYLTVTGGISLNFAMSPLFFELAVESAYPCSEVMVGGVLTACNNLVGLCFLFLFLVPFPSYQWVTYVLLSGIGASLIPLSLTKEDYSRSSIDRNQAHSAYPPI